MRQRLLTFEEAKKLLDDYFDSIDAYIEGLKRKPQRYITGVIPNIHNKTRKKQRLTRLQRRQKRQRK